MRTFLLLLCLFVLACHVPAQEQKKQSSLKPVAINGKWGYTDEAGNMVIPAQFQEAHPFSEGLAAVAFGTDPEAKDIITGSSGNMMWCISVERTDLIWGYIDETGKFIIAPRFNNADDFSEGLAGVMIGANWWTGEWGYIDKSGQMVIKPQFDVCTAFINGRAWVTFRARESGKSTQPEKVQVTNGEPVLLDRPDELVCSGKDGGYGYINRSGKFTETTCDEWFARKVEAK